jgi:hypothetical protein
MMKMKYTMVVLSLLALAACQQKGKEGVRIILNNDEDIPAEGHVILLQLQDQQMQP